ncbi:MAG TPA: 7TM diverse intracellular signaling domain-containing protein, partial [Spirochaetota bacterium]|nr:7TM diverse intracellular signaling domain-containing protein [Spirochaetota bacterium]
MDGKELSIHKLTLCIFFLFSSTILPLFAGNDVFTIHNNFESANVSAFLYYIPAIEDVVTIQDVRRSEKICHSIDSEYVNFGYTTTSHWFCLHIMNRAQVKDTILEFDYPILDYVDLYMVHDGKVQQIYNTGDRRKFSTRPLASRTLAFPLDLQHGMNRVFFKIKTCSSFNFSIFLHSREFFVRNNTHEMSLLFMFYGIMLFIGIFNFLIFFSTRDTAHLFFSFFSVSLMLYLMCLRGLGFMFLWPESASWANRAIPTFAFVFIGSASLFFDSMLKFHQYLSKKLRWGILLFTVLAAFMLAVQFLIPYIAAVQVVNYLLFGLISYVLATSIYSGIKDQNRNAWFILVGFLPLFSLAPLQLLASMGYLPTFFITQWKIEISFLWLILATSLGLADTINVLNRRLNVSRHSLEKSNIQLQEKNQELNATMEELEATNEEFEAQNEELLRAYWDLEQNELRYRSIVEDQTEFITRWDPGGIITFANRAYCHEFGLKPENMLGKSFFEFVPEDFHAQVWEKIYSLTSENPVKIDEHRVIRGDGSTAWHQWIDRAFFDDYGNPTGYQSVGRDITEKKETEIALRRLAITVEQASEDII